MKKIQIVGDLKEKRRILFLYSTNLMRKKNHEPRKKIKNKQYILFKHSLLQQCLQENLRKQKKCKKIKKKTKLLEVIKSRTFHFLFAILALEIKINL